LHNLTGKIHRHRLLNLQQTIEDPQRPEADPEPLPRRVLGKIGLDFDGIRDWRRRSRRQGVRPGPRRCGDDHQKEHEQPLVTQSSMKRSEDDRISSG
jgi:hypothetical protein